MNSFSWPATRPFTGSQVVGCAGWPESRVAAVRPIVRLSGCFFMSAAIQKVWHCSTVLRFDEAAWRATYPLSLGCRKHRAASSRPASAGAPVKDFIRCCIARCRWHKKAWLVCLMQSEAKHLGLSPPEVYLIIRLRCTESAARQQSLQGEGCSSAAASRMDHSLQTSFSMCYL